MITINLKKTFLDYSQLCIKGGYLINPNNEESINKIVQTIEENESGLIVYGNRGSGKTMLLQLIRRIINPQSENYFVVINCLDVVLDFNIIGHKVFHYFEDKNILFDDFGTEDSGVYFGDRINVMERFIQLRYELFIKKGIKTHFTTNEPFEKLEEVYGSRCTSRLQEMCNHVILDDSDKRPRKNFKGFHPVNFVTPKSKEEIEWEEKYNTRREELKNAPFPDTKGEGLGSKIKKIIGTK